MSSKLYQVRPDLCATDCDIPPRDFLGKIWTDSLVHDDAALRLLVEVIGEDRVILGTDYPFPLGEVQIVDTWPGKVGTIFTNINSASTSDNAMPHNPLTCPTLWQILILEYKF